MSFTYVTRAEVIDEMGFDDNAHVVNEYVDTRIEEAESAMNIALATAGYNLPLDSVPKKIRECVRLYAAGSYMLKDFPVGVGGTKNPGEEKMERAKTCMEKISTGNMTIVDDDGVELAKGGSNIDCWPNDLTADASEEDAGGERMFRVKHKF